MEEQEVKSSTPSKLRSPFKWVLLGVGGLVAVAHIGALGLFFLI